MLILSLCLQTTQILLITRKVEKVWKSTVSTWHHFRSTVECFYNARKQASAIPKNESKTWMTEADFNGAKQSAFWETHTYEVSRFLWTSGRSGLKGRRGLTLGQLFVTSAFPYLRCFAFNSTCVLSTTFLIDYWTTYIHISIISHIKGINYWSRKSARSCLAFALCQLCRCGTHSTHWHAELDSAIAPQIYLLSRFPKAKPARMLRIPAKLSISSSCIATSWLIHV